MSNVTTQIFRLTAMHIWKLCYNIKRILPQFVVRMLIIESDTNINSHQHGCIYKQKAALPENSIVVNTCKFNFKQDLCGGRGAGRSELKFNFAEIPLGQVAQRGRQISHLLQSEKDIFSLFVQNCVSFTCWSRKQACLSIILKVGPQTFHLGQYAKYTLHMDVAKVPK